MTFTNKAATEMKERTLLLMGDEWGDAVRVGTFHRTCLQILRRHAPLLGYEKGFVIYDTVDQTALVNRILKDRGLSDKAFSAKRVRGYIDKAKNEGWGPTDKNLPHDSFFETTAAQIYATYQQRLLTSNAMDFGDLINQVLVLFEKFPMVLSEYQWQWKYILVDEFQDTNRVQYNLLRALCSTGNPLCVVGDDDQSIYRWRGARVENILDFAVVFPNTTVVTLDQNYRSSGNILKAAASVIQNNHSRHPKTLWTEKEEGEKVVLHVATNERDEAKWIANKIRKLRDIHSLAEIAIFYRTNSLSRVVEDALRSAGLAYTVYGGLKFYERAEIKDLLAYMKLLVNPRDEVALSRAINRPTRGIGPGTLEKVLARAQETGGSPLDGAVDLAETGTTAVRNRLRPFCQIMEELMAISQTEDAVTTVQRILEKTGYWSMLREENSVEADARMENLHEFLASVEEFQEKAGDGEKDLAAFLDQVALASDIDDLNTSEGHVTLMTVHAAKGLEFDCVFVVGMEEDLLPHFNAQDSARDIEEERRLCYVAITRARHRLFLTRARLRRRFGGLMENSASRFLREIPDDCLHVDDPAVKRLAGLRREGFTGRPGSAFSARVREAPPEAPSQDLGSGVTFEPDGEDTGEMPGPGMPVQHRSFGRGTIRHIRGNGPDARVTVSFPKVGEKTVIARFLMPC
jgi:DNA helicase-2/ATP-dependent DNA helicase PcrA